VKATENEDFRTQKVFTLVKDDEATARGDPPQEGISQATCLNWKKKYVDMLRPEIKKLKRLEDEKARLPTVVAKLEVRAELRPRF